MTLSANEPMFPDADSGTPESILALALAAAEVATWHLDCARETTWLDARWASWLGYPAAPLRLTFAEWRRHVHPADWPRVRAGLVDFFKGKVDPYLLRYRLIAVNGEAVWVEDRGRILVRDEQTGRAISAAGVCRNITQERRQRLWDRLLGSALQSVPEAVIICDANGTIRWSNPAAQLMFLARFGDLLADSVLVWELFPQLTSERLQSREAKVQTLEWPLESGETRTFEVTVSAFADSEESELYLILLLHDVTELKRLQHELQHLALTDPLTGLPNRRAFMDAATQAWHRVQRGQGECKMTLALMDLDYFKRINDTFGHAAGDAVLRDFARLARQQLRRTDVIARFGGEEFALLLDGADDGEAAEVLQRLLATLRASELIFQQHRISYTTSIGATVIAIHDPSLDDVLARADRALYQAKANGRNQLVWLDPEE